MKFQKGHKQINNGKGCFEKGFTPWNKGLSSKISRICVTCDRYFLAFKCYAERKNGALYCSRKCKKVWNKGISFMAGNKNPNWKGGIANKLNVLRHTPEYSEWRMSVYRRDWFECQICGDTSGKINANHIKRFVDYPELRYKTSNGITLCVDCHRKRVTGHELEWESYFNFNLEARGI